MTAYEHSWQVRQAHGFRVFDDAEVSEEFRQFLDGRAWTHAEGPGALFTHGVGWLRRARVLLPGITVLIRASDTKADRRSGRPASPICARATPWSSGGIDRLGRNLRDLIDIVTTLQARGVGVRSLSNGLVDTTTAHGALVFGMFALMAEYEAALIRERTQAWLAAARARGRKGGRKPKMTPELIGEGPTHVRRPPVHHGRNRRLLRRHPHDDLPQHPHRRTHALTHARRSRAIRPVLRDRH
jgi:Resolvase, N terminal domain/Domain of unknown function (DUF4158)